MLIHQDLQAFPQDLNPYQITDNIIGSSYHNIHHFISQAEQKEQSLNERRLQELEKLELNYIGGLARNRLVSVINRKTRKKQLQKRLDEILLSLRQKNFQEVTLDQNLPKTVLVATIEGEIKELQGQKTIAIVMNNSSHGVTSKLQGRSRNGFAG